MIARILVSGLLMAPVYSHASEDPFLWLEDVDGEKALNWVKAQNASTADRLKSQPIFEELHQQALSALNNDSRIPSVTQRGDMLYNYWRDKDHPRGIYRRTTLASFMTDSPEWETVLDLDKMSEEAGKPIAFKGMSCLEPENRLCLVRLSPGGGDAVEIREFDSKSKTFVEDGFSFPVAKSQAQWIDADTLYIGTDFGPDSFTDSGYPRIAKKITRGQSLEQAKTLHEGDKSSVGAAAYVTKSEGGDIHIVREGLNFWTAKRWLLREDGKHEMRLPPSATLQGNYHGELVFQLKKDWQRGDDLYTSGSVLIAKPDALIGELGPVEVLIEADPQSIVESINVTDQGIVITALENVIGKLYRYRRNGETWNKAQVDLPDQGAISVNAIADDSGDMFVAFESFVTPETLFHVKGDSLNVTQVAQQKPAFDGSKMQVTQNWATSDDGTKVPYFMVHLNSVEADGKNPVHIFSYGGFRNALKPSYSGSYEALYGAYGKMWLERGGVFVLANIRGGGEFGPAWHQAALRENRPRAFEDFDTIAKDLIARDITQAGKIGIEGRSNGGLLVGAALTRSPELYGAVICGVPLLDMKRYHLLLAGASWMAEYGNPEVPEDWAFMKTWSPYQNLKEGVDYPPTFFFTSTRDDRVHPGHARKMAAKMLSMDQGVWYYENLEGGHGGSSTNAQLAYRLALAYTHLWTQLN